MADMTDPDTAVVPPRAPASSGNRAIVAWLFACAGLVILMMLVGAATRLTESGLSIAEWNPVMGALPPLSEAEWRRIFDLYRTTSEYRTVNAGMTLDAFQTIFWWEYLHRLLGRLIGVAFGLPLLWFLIRRQVGRALGLRLVGLFLLGGLQGGIGWWMVQSGIADRVDVSQYRLVVHLGIAFLILGAMLWTALDLLPSPDASAPAALRRGAVLLLALVFLLALSGGFVAGLDAGFVYNDWPLMSGAFLPAEYVAMQPWWLNPFENAAAAQFNHRMLAYAVAVATFALWLAARRQRLVLALRQPLDLLLGMAAIQISLGISTLLLVVPTALGVAHQGGAVAVFCLAVWNAQALSRRPR
jgi:cytochrome c oxidase assembly protein subunit 15